MIKKMLFLRSLSRLLTALLEQVRARTRICLLVWHTIQHAFLFFCPSTIFCCFVVTNQFLTNCTIKIKPIFTGLAPIVGGSSIDASKQILEDEEQVSRYDFFKVRYLIFIPIFFNYIQAL
jgi:hypothetical protein